MDTSEEYVKMSDCEEVQSQWPIGMDAMAHPATDSHDYTSTVFRPMKHKDYGEIKQVVTIWLPRQDQIQGMMEEWVNRDGGTSIASIYLACNFAKFCGIFDQDAEGSSNVSIRKGSLEQLWLAFYMYELHNKTWEGETWEEK